MAAQRRPEFGGQRIARGYKRSRTTRDVENERQFENGWSISQFKRQVLCWQEDAEIPADRQRSFGTGGAFVVAIAAFVMAAALRTRLLSNN